ncbi:MAG: hypothetical protein ACE5R6_08265 [Candidatus Heimdallarchaeota archaeon]
MGFSTDNSLQRGKEWRVFDVGGTPARPDLHSVPQHHPSIREVCRVWAPLHVERDHLGALQRSPTCRDPVSSEYQSDNLRAKPAGGPDVYQERHPGHERCDLADLPDRRG